MFRRTLFFVLLLFYASNTLYAQWKIVAPNAVHCYVPWEAGAIHCKDSIVWAADTDLVFSRDLGATWKRVLLPEFAQRVTDLSFLNRDTGVLATIYGFIFQTFDGGNTWKQVFDIWDKTFNFGYLARIIYQDSDHIYGILEQDGLVFSTDGGKNWTVRPIPVTNVDDLSLAVSKSGTLFTEAADLGISYGNKNGHVLSSSDMGVTWQQISNAMDGDCYSIEVDPTDSTRLYILDENFALPGDSISKVLIGNTQNNTWNIGFSHARRYLSGGMALSPHAIYVPSVSDGILRSTDQGNSWKNIGGPNAAGDSRFICAVDDNILFALDTFGNIWETYNSGGDSVLSKENSLSIAPSILFQTDTLGCNDLTKVIRFYKHGTSPPDVTGWSIIGPDSAHYSVSNFTPDSVSISLLAQKHGKQNASMVFYISDSTQDTVQLGGFVSASLAPLIISTQDEQTDTIGATISVPISFSGLIQVENVNYVLHFPTYFDYLGTFDGAGATVDLPSEKWSGRSKCFVKNVVSGSTVGWARFNVFADSSVMTEVTFDSVEITTAISPCEYIPPPSTSAIITPPSGCGIPSLSQMLRGKFPTFTILPNPTTGIVSIKSQENVGEVTVEVYDALGIERMNIPLSLAAQSPLQITLPKMKGIYYLRIRTADGLYSSHLLLKQ